MHNKRGLSAIITILLIVMLVLVAIGIVWAVISGVLRGGADDVSFSARCLNIDVRATAINCNTPSACVVTFTRTGSDDGVIGGVKLVFFEGADTSGVIPKPGNIEKLAGKTITDLDSTLDAPDKLEVTVYLEDESGNEQFCPQTTFSNIDISAGGGDDGGAVCPDGVCEGDETCLTCESDCGDCEGEFCGDGTCNGDETCETCVADCGVCGEDSCNGVWNPPEDAGVECDGGTGCTDCACDTGYVPADPLGPDCEVNPVVNCNGVFEEGEQCDGGDYCIAPGGEPLGAPNECTCPAGYDPEGIFPDGNGGCIAWEPINTGTVNEVWPSTGVFFASSNLPDTPADYTGYYVSYTGAISCKLIAYYLTKDLSGYGNVIVAFSTATNPVIAIDNIYYIWETSERCEASI